jgi:hypothetical protein
MKNKTTAAHSEEFALYVAEFQDLLNLRDWRIEPSGKPASRGAMAQVVTSLDDRLAIWSLGRDWGQLEVTSKTLRETALHEVLHVFLAPLIQAAASRDEDATAGIEHSVVVILEKLLSK